MAQTHALLATLKKCLKAHGMTYREVANAMNLSEASIKRLFSEEDISLERLEQICHLIGMEIVDLVKYMEAEQSRLYELSEEQESELVADGKLLVVAFLVINGWTFEEILERNNLLETELIRYLARLDRLKVIDLLPKNRIKLRIASNFTWRRNGPIQRFFSASLQQEFLKSTFDDQGESFQFLSGMLTSGSAEQLRKKLQQLAKEFHNLNQDDVGKPIAQRDGYSLLLACRPWRPDVFNAIRRDAAN